jgi:hypothetical protein
MPLILIDADDELTPGTARAGRGIPWPKFDTSEPWICPQCTAVAGAHYLTCRKLRLPAAAAGTGGAP